jgi:hypothetical protein
VKAINYVSLGVAVIAGVATLLLLFVPGVSDLLTLNNQNGLTLLLGWVTTLGAVALLVGILNLLSVHLRKAGDLNLSSVYNIVFLITFAAVLFMWALSTIAKAAIPAGTVNTARDTVVTYGDSTVLFAFKYIQTPVEASLSAVLAVVLVLAGARLIRTRRHWSAVLFIIVALVLIVGLAPIGGLNILGDLREGITQYLSVGAARGILLGVSLGVIATGLRVIFGLDQPYGE